MSETATSSPAARGGIRWNWDLGPAFPPADAACLLDLLAALHELGTLGKAAAAAGISYRSAWGLLRRCADTFGHSPVLKERGRGTQLSAFGERLLALDQSARTALAETHAPWAQRLQDVLFPEQRSAPERLRIAASHDLALADWIENGRHTGVDLFWRGSEEALAALVRGDCEVAGFHLPDAWPAEQATAWLGRWLKPRQYVCFPVMRRRHGLLTAPGNPLGITSLADVARLGLRMVNRQRGSGTRSMIDQLLAANRLEPHDIPGYAHEEFTHDAVAATIAGSLADVGFGIEAAAARYDLGFVPLLRDRYCLALPAGLAHSPAVAHLIRRFRGNTFRQRLSAMAGYEMLDGDETVAWERLAAGS